MVVLPIYNVLIVPGTNIYFQIDQFRTMARRAATLGDRVVLLPIRSDKKREDLVDEDFYPIGVTGSVSDLSIEGYVGIQTADRVNIDMAGVNPDHTIELTVSRRPETNDLEEEEEQEHYAKLSEALKEAWAAAPWGEQAKLYIDQLHSIGQIAVSMSGWMNMTAGERYEILATDSRRSRMEMMEKASYDFMEAARAATQANGAQKEDYQRTYREQAIKKQMQVLQKELDDMHPENVTDVQKFEKKIQESGMNETARGEAEKLLNRLRQESQGSMESGMLYDYLDFVTGLSWKKEEAPRIDLEEAEGILDSDHFGLEKVKRRIIQQIAVMNLRQQQSGSILLFVGAPGTGKTSIGQSIAKALHREYVRVSLGGVRDEADIRGHRRTYVGAMPGRIMDGIQKSGVSNPVMVLDEVDKMAASYNGDPASALLEVLDPEQNGTFTDHYMNVPYDLSDVMFICTANSLDTIPEPLLNRMEVIRFTGYTASDKFQIAKRHLLPKARVNMGVTENQLVVSDEVIRKIISDFTMESGVRGLRKRFDTLCRSAAVEIAKNPEAPVVVTQENLKKLLDAKPIRHDHILAQKKPGIVTGLAWTAAGGEILFIETLFTKGSGKVIITGQLGDVMKESVQIAVSLVKSMFPDKAHLFEENDLHIHVPEGAIPKDGPSAGITMTTALSSLVNEHAVEPTVAMTGEVSLRGVVTPIGGLPEKLMAAVRAGITKVFIPAENADDLEEVAEEVKSQLEIVPVSKVEQVLEANGISMEAEK